MTCTCAECIHIAASRPPTLAQAAAAYFGVDVTTPIVSVGPWVRIPDSRENHDPGDEDR